MRRAGADATRDRARATSRVALFPITTKVQDLPDQDTLERVSRNQRLTVADCDLFALADQYGTPLYLYDRATLDAAVVQYRTALDRYYDGESAITYAGKAFLCMAIAQWADRRDLWLDCTGTGELRVAATAEFPRARTLVHGVNKSAQDLAAAVAQSAVIVVDNLHELSLLADLIRAGVGDPPQLWIRVRPGLAVETHAYTQTGQADSKFGMSPAEALTAVDFCRQHKLHLSGLHFHQGSHFHNPEPVGPAISTILDIVQDLHEHSGWLPETISPGGGWGVPYHEGDLPHPPIEAYVRFVAEQLQAGCRERDLPLPRLQLEPGRSIVAQAGVALYRVGSVKQTATRRWLLIDGGLADNPRPALYNARYSALPVADPHRATECETWLAGPYCESGDLLIEALPLPEVEAGELIAVPMSGAYQLSMGSNYNGARRPAVLWLHEGSARLIQRAETLDDLVARDVGLNVHGL